MSLLTKKFVSFISTPSVVNVYKNKIRNKHTNFLVLSIHKVQGDNASSITSKVSFFGGKVIWHDFIKVFKPFPAKCQRNDKNSAFAFEENKGFIRMAVFHKVDVKKYINGSVSFNTEKFVDWLISIKETFLQEKYGSKQKIWKKGVYKRFKFYLAK